MANNTVMLDYNKLATEIDTYIESLDKEFIEDWLEDQQLEEDELLERDKDADIRV